MTVGWIHVTARPRLCVGDRICVGVETSRCFRLSTSVWKYWKILWNLIGSFIHFHLKERWQRQLVTITTGNQIHFRWPHRTRTVFLYFTTGKFFLAFPRHRRSGPPSNTVYFGSPRVFAQTGPRSVQPFLHSAGRKPAAANRFVLRSICLIYERITCVTVECQSLQPRNSWRVQYSAYVKSPSKCAYSFTPP